MPPNDNAKGLEQALISIAQAIQSKASKSLDANGWTVYDYGAFKEYQYTTPVISSSIIANGAFDDEVTLPAGMTFSQVLDFSVGLMYGDWNERLGTPAIRQGSTANKMYIRSYFVNGSQQTVIRRWSVTIRV